MLGRWDKRIVDQESDVPSIIFFTISYWLWSLKTNYFYFCQFIKKKIETILAKIFQEFIKKRIILGTSDSWWTSCLSYRHSKPVYYIVDWQIFGELAEQLRLKGMLNIDLSGTDFVILDLQRGQRTQNEGPTNPTCLD